MPFDNIFYHEVTIYTRSSTRGTAGSRAFTWTRGADLACFIQPARSSDITLAEQRGYQVSHVIYFGQDPGVEGGDYLLYEGTRRFDVQSKPLNQDELDKVWKVLALESEQRQ